MVIAASFVLLLSLGWVHLQLLPSYDTSSHLPKNSEIKRAEAFSDEAFTGTGQILTIVPVSPKGVFWDEENRKRVHDVETIIAKKFGDKRTLSIQQIWAETKPQDIEKVAREILAADASMRGRFLAHDARSMMVIAQESSGRNTKKITASVKQLKSALAHLPYAGEIRITGLPVLLASEFPPLINQLRTGLLLAILLAVGVVGFATRSFVLALATLVPNLLPLLFAEAVIWGSGSNLDITKLISLTIAFGIAIDNAVHVINAFNHRAERFEHPGLALKNALISISPALLASTVIVCVSAVITQFSAMPSINMLGRLLVLTLVMALATNLVVLPSFILFFERLRRIGKPKQSQNA
jgi:predicted RND superfamily exporter protein